MAIAGQVTVGPTTYPVGSALYGTCDTAAGTAAKVAVVSGFDSNDCMITGITVHIKFTNSNTVANPTLAIKATSSGTATTAKSIMRYGTTAPSTTAKTSWQAGSVISFTYDGTCWQMNGWLNDDSTYTVNNGTLTIQKNGTAVATFTANQSGNSTANITGTFTDENVKQTNITTQTGTYRLLMSATGDDTNRTEAALKTSKATYDASKEAFTFGSRNSTTAGKNSVAEGLGVYATGDQSHAEGSNTSAGGSSSHAEGHKTSASGNYAHAEGGHTLASGDYSHAEGGGDTDSLIATTVASGLYSHAEGHWATASGNGAHAEGGYSTSSYVGTIASGENSHAEGYLTTASGFAAHAEGSGTTSAGSLASGTYSHAEGLNTTASGSYSHTEGSQNLASNNGTHAEGFKCTASNLNSHAEGARTSCSGSTAHAEGYYTTASGSYSHAEGQNTIANHRSQHVFGEYNIPDDSTAAATERGKYVEIVGNGTSSAPSNARTLDWNGNEWIAGNLTITGADGLILSPPSTSSNDSADIIFNYGNDTEKARIWTPETMATAGSRLMYRYKNTSGTIVFNGYIMTSEVQSAQVAISCLSNKMMMYKCGRIVYFSMIGDFKASSPLPSRVTTNVGSITATDWRPLATADSGLAGSNNQISMQIKTDGTITMYNYTTAAVSSGWFRWSGCYITAY